MEDLRDFELYRLEEEVGEEQHALLRAPRSLPKALSFIKGADDVFNILMVDASGSMEERWPLVVSGWQEYIVPKLSGRTRIHVFDSQVRFMRTEKYLLEEDFTGYATNLVAAFETIMEEVQQCSEANVCVFFISDGHHNHDFQGREPDSVISQMRTPKGKLICVYVLGIGLEFPVSYSVDIRSRLHNGNANVPTLFLAKEDLEIKEQLQAISSEIGTNLITLKLNMEGHILPGLGKTSDIRLGEWIYFPQPLQDLPSFTVEAYGCDPTPISPTIEDISLPHLVDEVFPQWNSVLIQLHRKKADVPLRVFDFMKSLFEVAMRRLEDDVKEGKSLRSRLARKWKKSYEIKFTTLVNQTKDLIRIENKFKNEMELAESILRTTVTSNKFDRYTLKFKGHGPQEFKEDVKKFLKIYKEEKHKILSLEPPTLDDCCRIAASSMLMDLQDSSFPLLLRESKFDFLKTFTITGLPALASVKDASQVNPWTITIRNIVGFPYCVTSQIAFEFIADMLKQNGASVPQELMLEQGNEATKCNIIIPIVPASAVEVLKPLILSNLYAMMATFCILKNPHIIDYDAHIAVLSSAWFVTIRSFPCHNRPEYIRTRIKSIIATASAYFNQSAIKTYLNALMNDPDQALMTKSTREFDGQYTKCESLIKPMFFLYLTKGNLTLGQKEKFLMLLLAEFIGRTLPNYAKYKKATPYNDFFTKDLYSSEIMNTWIKSNYQTILKSIKPRGATLLQTFYTLDGLQAGIRRHISVDFPSVSNYFLDNCSLSVDMGRIKKLRNVRRCGDVRTSDFRIWAEEMRMPDASIRKASSQKQIAAYVCEGLIDRSSRDRTSKATMKKSEAEKYIRTKLKWEFARQLKRKLTSEIRAAAAGQWKEEYQKAHEDVAMPMGPDRIVQLARDRGVEVTQETFRQVYRYDDDLQLLRNACQISKCPHYLLPRRNFNQHLSVERRRKNYPHALHLVAKEFCTEGLNTVTQEVTKGTLSGTHSKCPPTPPEEDSLIPLRGQITSLLQCYAASEEKAISQDNL